MKRTNSALILFSGTNVMRRSITVAALCLSLLPCSGQQQEKPRGNKGGVSKPAPALPSEPFVIGEQHFGAAEEKNRPQQQPTYWEKWLEPAAISNLALFIAAIWAGFTALRTLRVIREQTREAARAAGAAEKSADFLVNSERAWLTARVENPDEQPPNSQIVWIEVPITNSGKTPGRIKKIKATSKLIPIPQDSLGGRPGQLPEAPDYNDGNKLILLVGRDILITPMDALRHIHVFIFPREWAQVKARELSLYVYGEIEYLDTVRGEEHKTCFCSIYWVPESGYNEPTGFMFSQVIPAAYFCAT